MIPRMFRYLKVIQSKTIFTSYALLVLFVLLVVGCKKKETKVTEQQLYETYCASCHVAPSITDLPKEIWDNNVLPDMARRLKIKGQYYDARTDTLPRPEIALMDWIRLKNYIVKNAPENLERIVLPEAFEISQFEEQILTIDDAPGVLNTFFEMNGTSILVGDIKGTVLEYEFGEKETKPKYEGNTAVTSFFSDNGIDFVTEVGVLDPSEAIEGSLSMVSKDSVFEFPFDLKRPVHTLVNDLNGDGELEHVVSEFGNETGQLSIISEATSSNFQKQTLLGLPGCVRTIAHDMNADGKLDLVVMTTQGNESITILYQEDDLSFKAERVLEFGPVYGSSWFELLDYNQDGHMDVITVNGDNADKSYVHKPYHGLRLFLNNGKNGFDKTYFYPLYGATRFVADDFDQDGDIDFGVVSAFPDYDNSPERSFVYLENMDPTKFEFKTQVLNNYQEGRWFLIDSGDIDNDGDQDIILSPFSYVFTPVPELLQQKWDASLVDFIVLQNKLYP